MQDSRKNFELSLRNILVLALVMWCLGRLLCFSTPALALYNYALGSVPAHNFLDRLADLALPHNGDSVLFLGPSTVREAFDTDIISKETGLYAVNCGLTSKGSISHTEMQLDTIENFGIKPDILVLGINSRMLSLRRNPVGSTRFVDHLNREQLNLHLVKEDNDMVPYTAKLSLQNELWPANRLSLRIDYLARFALMQANHLFGNWNHIPVSGFARGADLPLHPPAFLYKDTEFNQAEFEKHWQAMKQRGLFQKPRYGTQEDIRIMHRVIEKAMLLSPRVVVLVMPENSQFAASAGSWGDHAFYTVLDYYKDQIEVMDMRNAVPDKLIRDIAHLVPDGRAMFSEQVASYFNSHPARASN